MRNLIVICCVFAICILLCYSIVFHQPSTNQHVKVDNNIKVVHSEYLRQVRSRLPVSATDIKYKGRGWVTFKLDGDKYLFWFNYNDSQTCVTVKGM